MPIPRFLIRSHGSAHAVWALGRIGSAEARAALSSRVVDESDESVRSDLAAALVP